MPEPISEIHPLEPFLPINAKLLMMGSFPPQQKRWSMDFYYPNLQNDMWRIFGLIFFQDKDYFLTQNKKAFNKELIIEFLNFKGIALFDTGSEIKRLKDNASDKFLEIVNETDVKKMLLQVPKCIGVAATGQKAIDVIAKQLSVQEPKIGEYTAFNLSDRKIKLFRMPSSSRAYPLALEKKAEAYRVMFNELGLL